MFTALTRQRLTTRPVKAPTASRALTWSASPLYLFISVLERLTTAQDRVLASNPKRWSMIYAMSRRPPSGTWPENVEHVPVDFLQPPEAIAEALREKDIKPDYVFFFSYVLVTDESGALRWDDDKLIGKNSEQAASRQDHAALTITQTCCSATSSRRYQKPMLCPSVSSSNSAKNGTASTSAPPTSQTKNPTPASTHQISTTLNTTSSPPSAQATASAGTAPSPPS